jgi:hypothetical protein
MKFATAGSRPWKWAGLRKSLGNMLKENSPRAAHGPGRE